MAKRLILLVEDEHDVAGLIKHAVERAGVAHAQVVTSGDTALKAVAEHPPDLVPLDLNLPVVDGIEVCRILRSKTDAAAADHHADRRGGENDRVNGLEVGADDYISKPFSLRELTAPIRAVLRRASAAAEPSIGYDLLVETRSIDVHVGRLRAKLGIAGRQVETVIGLGYRFVE